MVLDAQPLEILNTKILVIQTSFLGDSILSLPFLQLLKSENPDASIHVISAPQSVEIFEASPVVDKVIALDKRGKHKSIFSTFRFAQEIALEKYSKLYSLHRSPRTSVLVFFSGVKETYGFDTSASAFVYKHRIHYNSNDHEVKRNLTFTGRTFSGDDWKILPEIRYSDIQRTNAESFIQNNVTGKKLIALAPGSIWETKRYPVEYYLKILRYFCSKDYTVLLLGGMDEYSLSETLPKDKNVLNLCGKFSLVEVHRLLKECSILICNDSALAHLGVSANIPVLMIYCSTVPDFGFYPYHKKGAYISLENIKCKPCGIHGYHTCPLKYFDCGKLLFAEAVINKAETLLSDEKYENN